MHATPMHLCRPVTMSKNSALPKETHYLGRRQVNKLIGMQTQVREVVNTGRVK